MTDLKDRAAKWLKSNGSLVVAGIGLILIAINDSFIGVFMYAVVIHILGFWLLLSRREAGINRL